MFKIHVQNGNSAVELFNYESNVLPMVGDVYADPDKSGNHYVVIKRLLFTSQGMSNIIAVWVNKTN